MFMEVFMVVGMLRKFLEEEFVFFSEPEEIESSYTMKICTNTCACASCWPYKSEYKKRE